MRAYVISDMVSLTLDFVNQMLRQNMISKIAVKYNVCKKMRSSQLRIVNLNYYVNVNLDILQLMQ